MFEKKINNYLSSKNKELQFRLGYKTLIKVDEWKKSATDDILSIEEWEQLKEYCLSPEEKIILETKGQVKGIYRFEDATIWVYSFVEWKDCFKAHFYSTPEKGYTISLQNPVYWDAMRAKKGLHIVTGIKGSGKSSFVKELLKEINTNELHTMVTHSANSVISLMSDETLTHLSADAEMWDLNHAVYDGCDTFILDVNEVKDWKKWIHVVEQGKKVILTLSATSIVQTFLQIQTDLVQDKTLWLRFLNQLTSVVNQKAVGEAQDGVYEVFVVKEPLRDSLRSIEHFDRKILEQHHYQTHNQSLIQSLIRRKIDVQAAFAASPDPDDLDQQLKKMGL